MTHSGNILIVDDEPHVRRFLGLVARGLGSVQIHEAPDGETALALFPSISPPPILVMLDVNMPGIDGIETLRRLPAAGDAKTAGKDTTPAHRPTIHDAIAAGADHYMRKDTAKEEILAGLQAVLDQAADDSGEENSAGA